MSYCLSRRGASEKRTSKCSNICLFNQNSDSVITACLYMNMGYHTLHYDGLICHKHVINVFHEQNMSVLVSAHLGERIFSRGRGSSPFNSEWVYDVMYF